MPATIASFNKWSGESDTTVGSGNELQIRSVSVHSNCTFSGINAFMRLPVTVV